MTSHTIEPEGAQAAAEMVRHGLRHLPVTKAGGWSAFVNSRPVCTAALAREAPDRRVPVGQSPGSSDPALPANWRSSGYGIRAEPSAAARALPDRGVDDLLAVDGSRFSCATLPAAAETARTWQRPVDPSGQLQIGAPRATSTGRSEIARRP